MCSSNTKTLQHLVQVPLYAAHDIKFISAVLWRHFFGPGVQRYVRTYVDCRIGSVIVYVSIVLVYRLILLGGGGGCVSLLPWLCWLFSACVSVYTYCSCFHHLTY